MRHLQCHETRACGDASLSLLHEGTHSSAQLTLNLPVDLIQQRLDVGRIIAVRRHLIGQLGTRATQ
jgi:hypothetical protein